MRVDTHVHTIFSGNTTVYPLRHLLRESYNSPEAVYRRAKSRGMDLVAITDHDTIAGALTLGDRPDVLVGCEVTAEFPTDGVCVHLGVLGLNELQHREIQRLRKNIRELLDYLNREELFVSINHMGSRVNGRLTAKHIAAMMPWVDGIEVRNGSRLPAQNRAAAALAGSYRKVATAGSDAHTQRGIGKTYIDAPHATTMEEFLAELRAGRIQVHGRDGDYLTMASDIVRIASGFYWQRLTDVFHRPHDWRNHAVALGAVAGLPLLALPVALAAAHFMLEDRFNKSLLFDLFARPARRMSGAVAR